MIDKIIFQSLLNISILFYLICICMFGIILIDNENINPIFILLLILDSWMFLIFLFIKNSTNNYYLYIKITLIIVPLIMAIIGIFKNLN